ncbi:MAG: hypothetical protein NC187_06815 [Candidatus Amulumruptor caecigallinarius]|nr:hypothetical protein [Candidatus Amulumruptor caecigallinarius]MCM1397181.1 hypothetical protein [Candidatus Amulumruptor caecigallinarius]MCM1453130.1 hypothetical protein [bacterium]
MKRTLIAIILFAATLCAASGASAETLSVAASETARVAVVDGGLELQALPTAAEAAQFEVYSILGTHQGKVTVPPSQSVRMDLRSGCYIVRCMQPKGKGGAPEAKVTSVKLTVK